MYKTFTYTNQKFAVPEMQGQAVSTVSQSLRLPTVLIEQCVISVYYSTEHFLSHQQ